MEKKEFVDYYATLGIKSNATDWEIRHAYRKLAKKYHPDKAATLSEEKQKEYEEKFKMIGEAHETLTKKFPKFKYDREYKAYQRKLNFTNVYQEDEPVTETIEENKESVDNEDLSAVWPKSKSRQSNQENKSEEAVTAGQFTELDEEYLYSISARRYEPRPKKKSGINIKNGIVQVSDTIVALLKDNQLFKKGKYSRRLSLKKKVMAGVLVVAIAGTAVAIYNSNNDEEEITTNVSNSADYEAENEVTTASTETVEETTEATEEVDDSITLYRIHKVAEGDILSVYSRESNTTIEELKRVNNTKSEVVQLGTDYIIPYIIEPEDLKFYTQIATYNPFITLEDFAKEYETNIATLETLNPEAVEYNGSQYTVSTDTLVVPNFITKEDYQVLKAAEAIQQKSYFKE